MLRHYHSLVRSKLDYSSFVYGSATKSKLSIIDTVHNMGIHIATGAFRASRLESLYAESGEPPLFTEASSLMQMCCKVDNSAPPPGLWRSIPSHPCNKLELNKRAPRPAGCAAAATTHPPTKHYSLQAVSNLTLENCPPYVRSATRQSFERRNILSHVPPVFRYCKSPA
jgi:hypothetical protein